jgi:hypothetical protein
MALLDSVMIFGVAEFRYEKLEGRVGSWELGVGRERITVCCENGESYINSATPDFLSVQHTNFPNS